METTIESSAGYSLRIDFTFPSQLDYEPGRVHQRELDGLRAVSRTSRYVSRRKEDPIRCFYVFIFAPESIDVTSILDVLRQIATDMPKGADLGVELKASKSRNPSAKEIV